MGKIEPLAPSKRVRIVLCSAAFAIAAIVPSAGFSAEWSSGKAPAAEWSSGTSAPKAEWSSGKSAPKAEFARHGARRPLTTASPDGGARLPDTT